MLKTKGIRNPWSHVQKKKKILGAMSIASASACRTEEVVGIDAWIITVAVELLS
jgi:hypothetical protein